jgi:hypothetical protein
MADAPNQNGPPPEVASAAAVVQKWLDEQPKPGSAPAVAEMTAAERFNLHRQQQFEQSRADEPNLRKWR